MIHMNSFIRMIVQKHLIKRRKEEQQPLLFFNLFIDPKTRP